MMVKEEDVEKHIGGGCMVGFFKIFDRPHLLSPKRFSLPKRLSSSSLKTEPSLDSESHSVYSTPQLLSPAPREHLSEFKQVVSPRRFSKEAPRLSLDSRAVVDAKGSLKPRQIHTDGGSGSPSVIARLMGLEALPDSSSQQQQPLQRSASESRVISRFVDSLNFQNLQSTQVVEDQHSRKEPSRARASTPVPLRRKSFFDTADFFPEPRQMIMMSRGSESDLETLKQLLEAHRLKGLLHSSCSTNRNVIILQSPIRSVTSNRDLNKVKTLKRTSENSVKTPNRRPTLKDSWRPEHVNHTRNTGGRRRSIEDDQQELNRHGKTLLERCEKLRHSIAEMEAAGDSQPSPVSVLDASLYHEDSSPSPVMKRTLDFTQLLLEDELFMSSSSSSDSEYGYISDILRASSILPQESDIFSFLEEKQQYLKCASAHERRLTFDAVQEIIGRIRRRGRIDGDADEMLQLTWYEFQKLRKKSSPAEEADLVGYVCGVLGRDLTEDPWRDFQVEMSEAVLDIERLVFKDLIGETILHMAALNRSASLLRRRRLLF